MTPVNRYLDRREAGHALGRALATPAGRRDAFVLALPRGGVPVGVEIAAALDAPVDVFVVRKVGLPDNPEIAMGAIATGGIHLLDHALIAHERIPEEVVHAIVQRETTELQRREVLYRGSRPPPDIKQRNIILVDDGVATGYTMRVAILALQRLHPAKLTVAIPVGAPDTCAALADTVDEFVCPVQPSPFMAVGLWYDHFPPVTDDEVRAGLRSSASRV